MTPTNPAPSSTSPHRGLQQRSSSSPSPSHSATPPSTAQTSPNSPPTLDPASPSPSATDNATTTITTNATSEIYPPSPHLHAPPIPLDANESDLPSVRRQHLTDGYRAGVSAGKSDACVAQGAFDAGFPLGARAGARVGFCLGVLRALMHRAPGRAAHAEIEADGDVNGEAGRRIGEGVVAVEEVERAERELGVARFVDESAEASVSPSSSSAAAAAAAEQKIASGVEQGAWAVLERWERRVQEATRARGLKMDIPGWQSL